MRPITPLFLIVALLLTGGATRLAYIEYSEGDALRSRASAQHTATISFPALRGDILDARGRVLAGSAPRPTIFVDPSAVDDPGFAAHSIAPVLGLSAEALERDLRERADRGYFVLKREVSDAELARFKHVRDARKLRAFGIQADSLRVYPYGALAGQILGFVGAEGRGAGGVELFYDEHLVGTPGFRRSIVDVQRRRLRQSPADYVAPRDGATVVLTIDAYVQQVAEQHLAKAVTDHRAEWGVATVLDALSGEVLAMANVPTFDPSSPVPPNATPEQVTASLDLLQNRAASFAYEPGSTFKPFVAALAMEDGLTRIGEVFAINGPRRVFGSRTINDTHGYASLLFEEILSRSSNIGMGLIGARCGNERMHRYVRLFGFGDATGVGLPGEHTGQVNDFGSWGPFSTQSIPIGQEISVTCLQLANAFNVFATDGVLLRPRVVRGIVASDGNMIWDNSRPIPVRRVMSEATARAVRVQALAQTVVSGTGKTAAIPGYQVYGKTGTAQIARPGGYLDGKYTASFVCGAPTRNPRLTVAVSVYKPVGQYYGGQVAAPAAGRILADVLLYMQVPAEAHFDAAGSTQDRAGGD